MDFYAVLDQVLDLLRRRGRMSYRALKRQFQLDDALIEDIKEELLYAHAVVDDAGRGLIWTGEAGRAPEPESAATSAPTPLAYTPPHLTEKILATRTALEGERKQVTVLFADIKDSTELIKDLDPEVAQGLLDPAIYIMMDAVHRYEGTVNQVLGDGIMALFGAPLAHEDHALRACYAALAMQAAMRAYTEEVRRANGMTLRIRVGLNAGEVVVREIGNDLHMDYSAVGQTTHLAARMEQLAAPGSIMLTAATLRLIEGLVRVHEVGPVPVKGIAEPVAVFELTGASAIRRRLQASIARGLTRFVGREAEQETLQQALEQARVGHGHVVAAVGEAGLGKSRLMYEFVHSHRTQGWLILESASVSYGRAAPYLPVVELLKHYVHIEDGDEPRTIRAKVTGHILTLDETLHETIPAVLFLLEALPPDSPFLNLDPPQRRQHTLEALKRILLRESQVKPLLLVFEDLHWIDAETQALLDSLVASLPTARVLLAVNYRPEYHHTWGSKTYYTQLRLDPLPPMSATAFLQALLGDDPDLEPLKQLLIERTGGNPFFLEESVRTLVETRVLAGQPGAYRPTEAISSIQVPATVQAVLAARIDRLPTEEKHLVQTAAVVGTEVPLPVLQAIVDLSEEELHRGLGHLQAAEFLYETRLFPEREYTFKHALTQQVAYQSLLTSRRQQVHGHIAQVLAERFPETADTRPELLAHHYTEAALAEPAAACGHKAGQKANECSAYVEAVAHLRRGLEVLETLPETPERSRQELFLQATLGESLVATQGHMAPEAVRVYRRVHELCRQEVGETARLFSVLVRLRSHYLLSEEVQASHELAEQLWHLARRQSDPASLQEAHWAMGQTLYFRGELVSARTHLEQSIGAYAPQPLTAQPARSAAGTWIASHIVAAWNLWVLGYPDLALHSAQQALRQARDLAHPYTLAVTLYAMVTIHLLRREVQAAREPTEALLALAREQGFPHWVTVGTAWQGWLLALQGQAEAGMKQVDQVLTSQPEASQAGFFHLAMVALPAAEVYGATGRAEDGLKVLAEALAVADKTGVRSYAAELHRLRGVLLLTQSADNTAEATACFHHALSIARGQQARSWELRAAVSLSRLWQQQGKRAEARALLAESYGWFTEGFETGDLREAKALLDAWGA